MASTMDAARPRAFEPASKAGEPVPLTPGWDEGPDRRIDRASTIATVLTWMAMGAGLAALGVAGGRLLAGRS